MRKLGTAIVGAALALSVFSSPSAAFADEQSRVPDDVSNWFETSGEDDARAGLVRRSSEWAKLAVGEPTRMFVVRDGSLTEGDEWIAPVHSENEYLGTISAWRSPENGEVELAVLDDSEAVAAALPEIAEDPRKRIFTDPFGGGRAVWDTERDSVQPLEGPHADEPPIPTAEYLANIDALTEQSAQILDDDLAGSPSGFDGSPVVAATPPSISLWWFGIPG